MHNFPEVNFSESGKTRYLHLGSEWIQGAMRVDKPNEIVLDYVQRMMAWLLFVPDLDEVPKLQAMQLGLGAAALTKFCAQRLDMRSIAVELNPNVIKACHHWFKLPMNDQRIEIIQADALQEISRPVWHGKIDALQVDIYDDSATRPILDSVEHYQMCRHLLSADGCMTVNLFGRSYEFEQSLLKITKAFGEQAVWVFKPTKEGNTIVLAQRLAQSIDVEERYAQAEQIEARYQLPASKWLKTLKPVLA